MPRTTRRLLTTFGILLCVGWGAACSSDVARRDEHMSKAAAYAEAGDAQEALLELRSALRLDPTSSEINLRVARIMESQASMRDAVFFYREARRLDPGSVDAAVGEAGVLFLSEPEAADEILAEVLEREPGNTQAHLIRSKARVVSADLEGALQSVLTSLELEPENPALYQQLGKVYQARIRAAQIDGREPEDSDFQAAADAFEKTSSMNDESLAWMGKVQRAKLLSAWPGHEDAAETAFRETLPLARGNARAMAVTAQDAMVFSQRTGRMDLLAESLEALLPSQPENFGAWSTLAWVEEKRGGSAEAVLRRMLEAAHENPMAHVLFAVELARRGRVDEAVKHLEEQSELGVDPPRLRGALVDLLYKHRRANEAEAVVAALLREYPGHPRTVLASAQLSIRSGRLEEAATQLRAQVGAAPTLEAWHLLAVAEQHLGNSAAALQAAEQAVELGKGSKVAPIPSLRVLLQLQSGARDWVGTLRSLSALERAAGSVLEPERVLQAVCLYEIGRESLARGVLEGLLERDKPYGAAAVEFARREGRRQPKRARAYLEKALEHSPFNAALLSRLAQMDIRANRPDKALATIEKALMAGNATPRLLLQRARMLSLRGDLEGAQRDALRAFEAEPGLLGASALLVQLYHAGGQEQEVIESFEEALAVGALRPSAQFLLAQLYLTTGNEARAQELLETVVATRSDLPAAKNNLAFLLAKNGQDLDRALLLAEEASQALTNRSSVADTLGYVYMKKGLHEPALEQFRYALEHSADDKTGTAMIHYHAGLAYIELGNQEEAANAFESALAADAGYEDAARALEALRRESAQADLGTS